LLKKGFLLGLMKCRRLSLGSGELRCLNAIASGPISAYGLYTLERKKIDIKNIRKTFKKIYSKELIEETGRKLPHNAKEYRLTFQGLFQYLLHNAANPIDLKRYSNDILLDTILYQFFDAETLDYFLTMFRVFRLNRYLRNCCEVILERIEQYEGTRFYTYYKRVGDSYFGRIPESLSDDIDRLILGEIENFIFQIVIVSKERIPDFILRSAGRLPITTKMKGVSINMGTFTMIHKDATDDIDDPNYQYAYPNLALAKDKKFTRLLDKIKTKFNDGSHDLLFFSKPQTKS
jgi:hypothetical protein